MKQLVLLTRSYCHLCDEFVQTLENVQTQWAAILPFQFRLQDVDADPELVALYDEKVPVLLDGAQVVCHWHFDRAALLGLLQAQVLQTNSRVMTGA